MLYAVSQNVNMCKKIFSIIAFVLITTFTFIGCGSDENSSENTPQVIDAQSGGVAVSNEDTENAVETTDNVVEAGSDQKEIAAASKESTQQKLESESDSDMPGQGIYEQITQDKAKEIMDSEEPAVILDVRTYEEYEQGHIDGATCIPVEALQKNGKVALEQFIPNKEQYILVYCRSGNRSKTASQIIADMGYINVKEFGGINDWQYGTVTE